MLKKGDRTTFKSESEMMDGLMRLWDTTLKDGSQVDSVAERSCTSCSVTVVEMTMEDTLGLEEDNQKLREDINQLRQVVNSQARNKMSLERDDTRVTLYTGLPSFATLMALFNFISSCVKETKAGLMKYQQFLTVLIKLHLSIGTSTWVPVWYSSYHSFTILQEVDGCHV